MPSGGCYIVWADRNIVVAKQDFISTSHHQPSHPENKNAVKMNHMQTHFLVNKPSYW